MSLFSDRRDECGRILELVGGYLGTDSLPPRDQEFLESMKSKFDESKTWEPTTKQLFWLRDIKDRSL